MNTDTLEREAEQSALSVGIPPCPAVLTGLVAEMRKDEPDFGKIAKLIGHDVALSATMLKTVNSPFYGLSQKVGSIPQALALLGLRNISHMVMRLLLVQAFPAGDSPLLERFWESSASIAAILAWLARHTKKLDRDEAYTYGLFRDCGVPVMMLNFADHAELAERATTDPQRVLSEIEYDELGMDHATLGHELAASWHLSEAACLAIRHHHDYEVLNQDGSGTGITLPRQSIAMIALGIIAERLYQDHCGDAPGTEWRRAGKAALLVAGLTEEELAGMSGDIDAVIERR